MDPLTISATNLRTFPAVDWKIPEGICAITGANGAGKSTLLGAIELALFADGSRDLAPALGGFDDRLEIELTFEHDGDTFRVRRGYTGGGRGKATLDFEEFVMHYDEGRPQYEDWQPLTKETASSTQQAICDLIGLSRRTFNASAFLAQGNSAAFPDASPAERKAILGEILDPRELWPRLAVRAAAERKQVEAALAGDVARIADREQAAASLHGHELALADSREQAGRAKGTADLADLALDSAQAALAANEAAVVREQAAAEAVRVASDDQLRRSREVGNANLQAQNLPLVCNQLAGLTAVAVTVPALEQKVTAQQAARHAAELAQREKAEAGAAVARQRETVSTLESEAVDLQAAASSTLDRLAHLNAAADGTERCAECKQLLGAEARAEVIQTLDEKCAALAARLKAKYAEKEEAENALPALVAAEAEIVLPAIPTGDYTADLQAARQAAEQRAALQVQIAGYEEAAAKLPELTAALAEAEATLAQRAADHETARAAMQDNAALEQDVNDARNAVIIARSTLDGANAQVIRAEEAVARTQEAKQELADLRATTAARQLELDTLRLAERAYGRDGIPALIAENAIPQIEAEANRILERLPTANGTVFRIEMRTQRALKSSEGVKETLDILVSDRSTTREFLTFSGGERFRVSFALRWALAKLLAGRRGAESRLLVIDEPDGLDAGGMDGLAAVLRDEASSFSRVLLVSHNPLLASAFEQVLEVESDGEVSRIVGALDKVAA